MTIRQVLIALPCLALGWLVTLLVVAFLTDAAPAYVILLPPSDFVAGLDPDMSVLEVSAFSVTIAAKDPDVARRLYGLGAGAVLPAGLPGCLPAPAGLRAING